MCAFRERWYYAADRLGVMVAQDMVQHYGYPWIQGHINGNHSTAEPSYYWHDLKALIEGRGNHPCIFRERACSASRTRFVAMGGVWLT